LWINKSIENARAARGMVGIVMPDVPSIEPIAVDVVAWVSWIEASLTLPLKALQIETKYVDLTEGTAAKIRISGGKNWRGRLEEVTRGAKYEIDRINLTTGSGQGTEFALGSSAWLRISDGVPQELLGVIRNSLTKTAEEVIRAQH
jgi:hypothetical protein